MYDVFVELHENGSIILTQKNTDNSEDRVSLDAGACNQLAAVMISTHGKDRTAAFEAEISDLKRKLSQIAEAFKLIQSIETT